MSNDLWRWADPGGQQRRVRLDELRAALAGGVIAPNTPVWKPGWKAWQPAHDVPELTTSALSAANGVVPNIPPPPLAVVAVQLEYEAQSGAPDGSAEEEPPPPPAFVPLPVKPPPVPPAPGSSGRALSVPTEIGGSAVVVPAPGAPANVSGGKLGKSLPTKIGIPPPPELQELAANARAKAPLVADRAVDPMIEELSGSMLLEEVSNPVGVPFPLGNGPAPGSAGLPAPTNPTVEDLVDDDVAGLPPRRPGLSLILDDLKEIRAGRPPRNKLLIGVVAIVGLSVVISILALFVSLVRGKPSDPSALPSASVAAAASSAPPEVSAAPPPAPTTAVAASKDDPKPPPPSAADLSECRVAGDAKTIGPRLVIGAGVEAVPAGSNVALGFASTARDAVATSLDPATVSATTTARTRTMQEPRRVVPVLHNGKLTAIPDVELKGDRIAGRRVVAASSLIDLGVADNSIVWAPHGRSSYAKLFALEGDGPVEALRAVRLASAKGIALTFRRGSAIYAATATGDAALSADGSLSKIPGLGQVGSPAIAASGDHVMVAWADRAGGGDSWQVRWTKLGVGQKAGDAKSFAIPEGGLGGQAMSPSVAALGRGRFLLAWMEGPVSNHQIRAITMNADGEPVGSPLTISAAGVNAGQPAAAVAPDGRGVVAFVAVKGRSFELHATPITCSGK